MLAEPAPEARADLYWIPLGAGGTGFVTLNGRLYEWWKARTERRHPLNLYHTALQLHGPEGRFVLETMWPSPPTDPHSRGVVFQGAVGAVWLARWRWLRYEVRRWADGILADAGQAVDGPQTVSTDPERVQLILRLAESVPDLIWGRDEMQLGEMWNSDSVIAWVLTRAGIPMEAIQPPSGGRAPGWDAGVALAYGGSHGFPDQPGASAGPSKQWAGSLALRSHWPCPGALKRLREAAAIPRYGDRTAYRPPPALYARLQWIGHILTALGLSPDYVVTLKVPGRRTGVVRDTSLILLDYMEARYLVALAGESEWVRNVRANGGRAVLARGRRHQQVTLHELAPADRAEVLHAYLWRGGRRSGNRRIVREADVYFGLRGEPPMEELQTLADRYPVFRLSTGW